MWFCRAQLMLADQMPRFARFCEKLLFSGEAFLQVAQFEAIHIA
jgi:hypothetical protein